MDSFRSRAALVAAFVCTLISGSTASAATVETLGSSSIARDENGKDWTVSAGGARLILSIDRGGDYKLAAFESPTGRNWANQATDTWVIVNGKPEPFGARSAGFEYERVITENTGRALHLAAVYRYRPSNLRVVRHVMVVDGSPTFELWTSFESLGSEVMLSDLNGFELKVRDGTVRWLDGLLGSASDTPNDAAFSLHSLRIPAGEGLTLTAQGRSSETAVPWFAIDGDDDEFYAGLLWSGAWTLNIVHGDDGLGLSLGLQNMNTQLRTGSIDAPHVIIGTVAGRLPQASEALRRYMVDGVRNGRGFTPLVTYNTWFADGTRIDDRGMRGTMQRAAAIGTELFVLDAGWYAGAGAQGVFDFHSGLGRWEADPDRFPDGLGALSDYAHELGMRFGIWVEPERMDLDVVAEQGADSTWLATSGGQSVTDRTGQICLAGAAGRRWVWERLTSFIDQVHPDYLKWDNNAWQNCDRDGHGHGPSDGNYAHVSALYGLLNDLRARYPDMLIENVSGGGTRLDLGMLRYTDVGWMDDRSAPGVHVRHNLQGLSAVFPPAYLLSFVTVQDDSEHLTTYQDLASIFRSRMLGALGMSFPFPGLAVEDALPQQIALYQRLRAILSEATGMLLTEQALRDGGPPWDAFQAITSDASRVVIYAFQTMGDSGPFRLVPAALAPEGMYRVESMDVGDLGAASGRDLMVDGIDLSPSERSSAHVLILTRTN